MGANDLIMSIGLGVFAELMIYMLLKRTFKLQAKAAAMAIAMLVVLAYVPWAIMVWPGADVFSIHLAIYLTTAYALGMIGSRQGKGWHWAPALIVAFFVGVITINIVFVSVAEQGITGLFAELLPKPRSADVADSRFPGVVSHDYQEKEALYNAYLVEVEEQKVRGWKVNKGWAAKPRLGVATDLIAQVLDRDGVPVEGAKVSGSFLRTSNSREDFSFDLVDVGSGEYRAPITMPKHGLWQMVLMIHKGDDRHEVRATTEVASVPLLEAE